MVEWVTIFVLYQAKYDVVLANNPKAPVVNRVRIAGKYCESGDILATESLPEVKSGDVLAMLDTGAYGYSMASNYNRNPRPAVVFAENRKARHDYTIHETYEAGIALTGTEVKSLRAGKANMKDSYAQITKSAEVIVSNLHISPYDQGNRFNHEPLRDRKLLLHKAEILRLIGKVKEKGYTLVPLKMYFSHGLIKIEIALATGKKLYDKRQDMAKRDAKREVERAMKERNR